MQQIYMPLRLMHTAVLVTTNMSPDTVFNELYANNCLPL